MFYKLPDHIINYIYTFYNPNKITYDTVLQNLKSYFIYKKVVKQFNQYCIHDINKNIISFQFDAILQSL